MTTRDRSNDTAAGGGLPDLKAAAERLGLPYQDAVAEGIFDPQLVANLPVEWARSHGMLPVRIDGVACVLMDDPAKISQQEDLMLLTGEELRPVLAPAEVIARSIERCYFSKDHSPGHFIDDMDAPDRPESARSDVADLLQVAQKTPVTQLVNLIVLEAMKRGASDIHFEPLHDRMRVRYRVDGVLYEQASPPKHMEDALTSRIKVMAHMDIAERRLPQDGMARVRIGEREIDVRVSTVPVAEGERVVLRLLDRDAALLPLGRLGMPEPLRVTFESLLEAPHGMIVVSGPTGSGKTTTLYAALGRLDASRRNIMTIEEPIEYQIPNIGQIQVKPKIGLTFAAGLRHILRQDPDIVLVGETRDLETAEIAVRASLTGHLVFTTLHTNDAPGAILRLVDMGVEPYLLASCLRAVLSQRLVRRLCPACHREGVPSEDDLGKTPAFAERLRGRRVWSAVGCPACLEGYRGRLGLFELMEVDCEIQEMIRDGRMGSDTIRGHAALRGMQSLLDDGIRKVIEGVTSLDEVACAASS